MKRRKILFVMGAVVTILLMASSSTAVSLVNASEVKEMISNDEIYVDPNTYLTQKHLPILNQALAQMEENQYRELIHRIIELIERKGFVDNKDVRQIVSTTNSDMTIGAAPL